MPVFVEVPYGFIFASNLTKTRLVNVAFQVFSRWTSTMLKIFHEWRFLPWGWGPLTDQRILLCFCRMMRIYSRFIGDGLVTHWSFWDRSPRLRTQVSENPFENDLHLLLSHFDTLNNPLAYHMSVNITSLCRYSFFTDFFAICSHTEISLFHIFRELCEMGGVILGGLLDATRIACQNHIRWTWHELNISG